MTMLDEGVEALSLKAFGFPFLKAAKQKKSKQSARTTCIRLKFTCRPPASIKIPIANSFEFEHTFASSLDITEGSEGDDPLSDSEEIEERHDGTLSEPELTIAVPLELSLCRRRTRSVDFQHSAFTSTERCRPAFVSVHSLLASTSFDCSSCDEDDMGDDEDE